MLHYLIFLAGFFGGVGEVLHALYKFCGLFFCPHDIFCGNPETGKYKAQKSTDGNSITEKQFANRMILRDVMLRHGFKPIEEEWWHFTLGNEPYPKTYFNFPIKSTKK
ncbi:MAG: hypothetical protein IK120_04550 [Muribaculaceae bacterium]|nr:hypothetical protein [Muribaculaceae bacterium]